MSQITTHILDTAEGKPAAGVRVMLFQKEEENWIPINGGITNADGRLNDLLPKDHIVPAGIYRLKFETEAYFYSQNKSCFYPFVEINFEVKDKSHYHVPLLLNPYGYTTYRGS